MAHRSADPAYGGWTRDYRYDEPSLLEPDRTRQPADRQPGPTRSAIPLQPFGYDEQGNTTAMPEIPVMAGITLTGCTRPPGGLPTVLAILRRRPTTSTTQPASAYARSPDAQETNQHARKAERIYIGAFEVYREYGPDGTVTLERETLHVFDDKHRVALVETRTAGTDRGPGELIRYQLANHLDSAVLELDQRAQVISYEEYYPYGSTSYQAVRADLEAPKRYRYTGKERDTETGLYYHGARYYIPWLARWASCDPAGLVDGTDLYTYARGNPIVYADPSGTQCDPTIQSCSEAQGPTAREEALQRSLPENERYLPPPVPGTPPAPAAAPAPPPAPAPQWKLGPRDERIPTDAWTGGPLRPASEYTKPYAMMYAAQGDYEAAELAEHYMCPTCHVLTQVNPHDFSLGGYVRGYQKASIQGLVEAPLAATPIGAAWEIGVSGGQALTGEGSGLHISNISSVLVDGKSDLGTTLSPGQRAMEGVSFGVGAVSLGLGLKAPGGGGAGGAGQVIVDTNATVNRPGVMAALRPGETPVMTRTVQAELRNIVARGSLKGFPKFANELPVIEDTMDLDTRILIRSRIKDIAPASPGLFGDGAIGATAVNRGLPVITNDRNLTTVLRWLGVEVRKP